MTIKTIFLDRDGVINKDTGYLHRIEECVFTNGIFDSCKYFQKLGYKIVVITNQSGIQRGYFSENDFQVFSKWMLNQFSLKNIDILDIFHCPHSPKSNCACRKPQPGMFLEAQNKYNIDMDLSWMIGDNETDISAATNAGIKNTILLQLDIKTNQNKSKAKNIIKSLSETRRLITN